MALELRRLLGEDFSLVTGLVLSLIVIVLVLNLRPSGRNFAPGIATAKHPP